MTQIIIVPKDTLGTIYTHVISGEKGVERSLGYYKGMFLFWLDRISRYVRHPERTFKNKKHDRACSSEFQCRNKAIYEKTEYYNSFGPWKYFLKEIAIKISTDLSE